MIEKLIRILTNGLYLVCVVGVAALPTAAFAQTCIPSEFQQCFTCVGTVCTTTGNTTNYTTSTKTIYDTSYSAVTQQVNTFSTQIIGLMQGGPILYDQTFNAAFTDAQIRAYMATMIGNFDRKRRFLDSRSDALER